MGKLKTKPFEIADYLDTPARRARFLATVIEESDGDAYMITKALGHIAKAEGMSKVAKKSGLSRESLYKALSGNRNPEFGTIFKVMEALGLQFRVTPMPPEKSQVPSVSPAARISRTKRAASPLKKTVHKPSHKRTSLKTPPTKSRTVAKATRST
jgi:probable addiction module antidote protein